MGKKVMGKIEKIYYEYDKIAEEDKQDTPEVSAAIQGMYDYLDSKGLKSAEYEDFLYLVTVSLEKQGFINGFKYARDLLLSDR